MTHITQKQKVQLRGRGVITLVPRDHIATGGEGSVYRKNDTVIKLYTDNHKMRMQDMCGKISALKRVTHPYIVTPDDVVEDMKGHPIGYYMPYVVGDPLARIFTNDYRAQIGFCDDYAHKLVDDMRNIVTHVHSKKVLMVDANEMNWLVVHAGSAHMEPRVIDVDAWQIDRWMAQVMMPSIRDWHTKQINANTDWFAWAIVTFQVYTGIHPYKGRVHGYTQRDLAKRMQDNISVFHQGVHLNRAVRDFGCIPQTLRLWYEEVFSKGKRSIPPSPYDTKQHIAPAAHTIHAVTMPHSGMLVWQKLYQDHCNIARVWDGGLVVTQDRRVIDIMHGVHVCDLTNDIHALMRDDSGWFIVELGTDVVHCRYIHKKTQHVDQVDIALHGHNLICTGHRICVVTDGGLVDIKCDHFGKTIITTGTSWPVLQHATIWGDGCGVEDMMGRMHVIVPYGKNACATIHVEEIDDKRVVYAYARERFISITVLDRQGLYHKYELWCDALMRTYAVWHDVVDLPSTIVTALPKGVCASITNDGEIDVFVPSRGQHVKVQDSAISMSGKLSHHENNVIYVHDSAAWSVRMT